MYTVHWVFVWELTGDRQEQALRALRVVAAIQLPKGDDVAVVSEGALSDGREGPKKKARGGGGGGGGVAGRVSESGPGSGPGSGHGLGPGDALERWVENKFLGLVYSITFEFSEQPLEIQQRRLETFSKIIQVLPSRRLARFVPKVRSHH